MTCSSMFLLDSEQVNPSGVIESVAILVPLIILNEKVVGEVLPIKVA